MTRLEPYRDFDREQYNRLPSIEAADREVRADGALERFLAAASKIFVHHGMQHRFGVGLLHKHHLCEADERMIQYNCMVDGEKALVTLPVQKTVDVEREVPHVWARLGRTFAPLEYTTDACARDVFFSGDVPVDFLADFAGLLDASPTGDHFGLAVVKRSLSQLSGESEVLLEHSDLIERKSVVFLRQRDETRTSIATAWTFEQHSRHDGITAETECVTTHRCECIVDDPGGGLPPKHSDHFKYPHHINRI